MTAITIKSQVGSEYPGQLFTDGSILIDGRIPTGGEPLDSNYAGYIRGGIAEVRRVMALPVESRVLTIATTGEFPNERYASWLSEVVGLPVEPTTISLAPTDEGYSNIAQVFVDSIVSGARKSRQEPTANLLQSLIEATAYLAQKGEYALVQRIIDRTKEWQS